MQAELVENGMLMKVEYMVSIDVIWKTRANYATRDLKQLKDRVHHSRWLSATNIASIFIFVNSNHQKFSEIYVPQAAMNVHKNSAKWKAKVS